MMAIRKKKHISHIGMVDNKAARLFGVVNSIESLYNEVTNTKLFKHRYVIVMKITFLNLLFFQSTFGCKDIERSCILTNKPCVVAVAMSNQATDNLFKISSKCFYGIF